MWPIIEIMRGRDGVTTTDQMESALKAALQLPAELAEEKHRETNRTEIGYRAAWARTRLRQDGYIERVQRSTWRLTNRGQLVKKEQLDFR